MLIGPRSRQRRVPSARYANLSRRRSSAEERDRAVVTVVLGVRLQRDPRRYDRHDLDRVRTQSIEHAIPVVDELAQLPLAVLGDYTPESRMILKAIDASNQLVDDLRFSVE